MSRRALAGTVLGISCLLAACGRDTGRDGEGRKGPDALDALVAAQKASAAAIAKQEAAPRLPRMALRVLVAGDLIPHRPSLASAASVSTALAPLGPLFGGANAVIANYEAATATGAELPKRKMAYAAPRGWLGELRRAGLTAVTVANNHACDLEGPGVTTTLDAARAAGLVALGGDAEDPWAPRVVAEANGKRVCVVAWTTQMNAEGACGRSKHLAIASPGRRARVDAAIRVAKTTCDATIAVLHGGEEYAPQTETVMDLAHHVADVGADAVVVHHPHVASPVELHTTKDRRRVPVFASVGNLASNQGESWTAEMFPVLPENRRLVCVNAWTRLGMIADLSFDFEETGVRMEWGYHLVWNENEHATDRAISVPKIEARLLDPERDRGLVAKLAEDRKGPVPVFEDPCWIESPGSEDARAHRCRASSMPSSVAAVAPPVVVPAKAQVARARRRR